MLIIDRYLLRDALRATVAVTLVLLLIMIGNIIAQLLVNVAEGQLEAGALGIFVLSNTANLLVTIVPLGVFVGSMLALGQMYRDSEMAALVSCGWPPIRLYKPLLMAALPSFFVCALLSLWGVPYSQTVQANIVQQLADSSRLEKLLAGEFITAKEADAVLFAAEADKQSQVLKNVFLQRVNKRGDEELEVAQRATYQYDEVTKQEYLVLLEGEWVIGGSEGGAYQVTEFAEHGIALPPQKQKDQALEASSQSTLTLLQSEEPKVMAEFHWRLAVPLTVLVLAVLAVPMSHTEPRKGPYGRIAVGVLIYIVYANLLVLARKEIESGDLPGMALYIPHALVVLSAVFMLWRLGWLQRDLKAVRND